MKQLTILFFIFFSCCTLVSAYGVTEDEVYLSSLAANIEKSGLLTNFAQSWKQHIEMWEKVHTRAANDTGIDISGPTNGSYPNNGTGPTPGSFKCDTKAPDVHDHADRLHPSHIDIVAAMGASMVAGTGADATRFLETTLQYRGVAFPIGGDGTLNDTLTVPNILKAYNSRLHGWSRSIAPAWFEELSSMNLAVPGATAADLDDQAKELVKRMKKWPGAPHQWKLVTIFIGMNDLCEACDKRTGGRASTYGRNIKSALDKLEKGLNKTVVNLVALPPMHQWYMQLHDDAVCWALHRYMCPCINDSRTDLTASEYNAELYKLPERYTRPDFTVVVQPFMSGFLNLPKVTIDGVQKTDQSFFAPDCFHFSRRGHAAAARSLWTNMFQAVGRKSNTLDLSEGEISCPDQNCPFIRTGQNTYMCPTPSGKIQQLSTHHSHMDNLTSEWWDWIRNHTLPPYHLWNITENITIIKPWHHNLIKLAQIPSNAISSSAAGVGGWIAFGVLLALAVVATALVGYVDLKKRRGQRDRGERTPLLTGSNVEQIY